jgi:hypothetical protein
MRVAMSRKLRWLFAPDKQPDRATVSASVELLRDSPTLLRASARPDLLAR